ncbi:MAG TPA: TA system VapC family ribonuclease toxin [Fimbriimonas sp.]|nr:TA system VapC family ribonuclease toxin [Fimbriimonas sp.]
MVDLPDINVWIALTLQGHPHHESAKRYWADEASAKLAFNSHTMFGLVRILSNVRQLGPKPLSPAEAWAVYRDWRRDEAVALAAEPKRCPLVLDGFVQAGLVQARTWSDAYLAAFAISGGFRLVSCDGDFKRFPSLNWLFLEG